MNKVNKKYLHMKRASAYDNKSQIPKLNVESTRNNKAKKPMSYLHKTDRIRSKNQTIINKNVSPMKLPNLDTNFLKQKPSKLSKKSSALKLHLQDQQFPKFCSLCNSKHAANEPHKIQKASNKASNNPLVTYESQKAGNIGSKENSNENEHHMSNRQMGLGRAPGIDLGAIYNTNRFRVGEKPKKTKHKQSEFSKQYQNVQSDYTGENSTKNENEQSTAILPKQNSSGLINTGIESNQFLDNQGHMSSGLMKESHEQSLATLKKPKLGPMVYHSIDQAAELFDDQTLEGNQ